VNPELRDFELADGFHAEVGGGEAWEIWMCCLPSAMPVETGVVARGLKGEVSAEGQWPRAGSVGGFPGPALRRTKFAVRSDPGWYIAAPSALLSRVNACGSARLKPLLCKVARCRD
jgi:hypothetical protein